MDRGVVRLVAIQNDYVDPMLLGRGEEDDRASIGLALGEQQRQGASKRMPHQRHPARVDIRSRAQRRQCGGRVVKFTVLEQLQLQRIPRLLTAACGRIIQQIDRIPADV